MYNLNYEETILLECTNNKCSVIWTVYNVYIIGSYTKLV